MSLQNCKTNVRLQTSVIAQNSPVLGMRVLGSAVYGPAHVSLTSNSLINFPAIVSHDYSVISLALNNIFCPKKLSIQRVYVAVASQNDSRQQ